MCAKFQVRAKKALGQHFLNDPYVCQRIAGSLDLQGFAPEAGPVPVLEVGPGTGVLTQHLLENPRICLYAVEIDRESVAYLQTHFPQLSPRLLGGDFLAMKAFPQLLAMPEEFCLIGNFPYNISSQIFFKVLEWRARIPQVVGMIQKEVADRLSASPGTKAYGILSVLLQAWYDIEYLFTVPPGAFVPPPKVNSAVIRLRRNGRQALGCDEEKLKTVVKTAFNQRRKTLRNSLQPLVGLWTLPSLPPIPPELLSCRPEQLSVEDFIRLTQYF